MKISKNSGVCQECKKIFRDGFEIVLDRKLFSKTSLCTCCASKLYGQLGKAFIPKSLTNINSRIKEI